LVCLIPRLRHSLTCLVLTPCIVNYPSAVLIYLLQISMVQCFAMGSKGFADIYLSQSEFQECLFASGMLTLAERFKTREECRFCLNWMIYPQYIRRAFWLYYLKIPAGEGWYVLILWHIFSFYFFVK
jgi:hypothetical protein